MVRIFVLKDPHGFNFEYFEQLLMNLCIYARFGSRCFLARSRQKLRQKLIGLHTYRADWPQSLLAGDIPVCRLPFALERVSLHGTTSPTLFHYSSVPIRFILQHMAVMWVRVPASRRFLMGVA
jgi:hypothetical protein